jgi:hypothetical protein
MGEMFASGQTDDVWEDLVVAILSVNQYSLERTYTAIAGIRREGISTPDDLASWELEEIVARLKAAGCDRGLFMTQLFAVRLAALGMAIRSRGIEVFGRILLSNDPAAINNLLLPINGIGPKVLRNFFLLRGIA